MLLRTFLVSLFAALGAFGADTAAAPNAGTPAPAPDLARNPAPVRTPLNPALPTLFVAGDSTAARGKGETQQGWGVPFADYFDPAKINVANRARGGTSSRTFITSGLWDQLLADLKKDDIVLIQFGHNDGGALNDEPPPPLRARGTIPGLGEKTKEIDNVLTKKHEVVHTYGWYMRKMIADVKAKEAHPIVLGLTVRNIWNNGRIERGPARYSGWAYEVAKAADVPFIDLSDAMADKFEALGEEKTKALYPQDHTHFNAVGADLHAQAVVAGLKGLRPNRVEKVLSAKGEAIEADKAAWLRLPFPENPNLPSLFLAADSTVRNGAGDGAGGQWGWGDFLGAWFDPEKINLVNRAVGGTGIETFRALGYWQRLLAQIRPGDFVVIQFGHNDNPPRGPAKGIDDHVEDMPNPKTKEPRPMHTWGWYLRQDIADVRARGATPIVCSLVPRKLWKDGRIERNKDTFAGWAQQVAESEKVAFVDLNELIAARYDALGEAQVNPLFADEHTHTSEAGAKLNAEVVAKALRELPGQPLKEYFRTHP
jgi:lysophospholipase L1-like esterase